MNQRFVKKRFRFLVSTAGGSFPDKAFLLDKNIKLVRGILLTADKPDLLFYRGTQQIRINGDELFPEEYESKLLMSGINVAPDQKFADLGDGVIAGNGEVKVVFKDVENSYAPFEPYEVSIYLICELG